MRVTMANVVYANGEHGPYVTALAVQGREVQITVPLTAEDRERLIKELEASRQPK